MVAPTKEQTDYYLQSLLNKNTQTKTITNTKSMKNKNKGNQAEHTQGCH